MDTIPLKNVVMYSVIKLHQIKENSISKEIR